MKALARCMRDDSGVAIIAVMGVLAVITVIAIAAFYLGQQTLHEATVTQRHSRAFQAASAGMDAALAEIQSKGLSASYTKTGSISGLGSYVVTLTALPSGEYKATSTGTSPDGSIERVSTLFFYLNLWDMSMGAGPGTGLGGGSGWNGNASIQGPLYIRGNMEWSANANYEKGPLFVKDGQLNITGSGNVGAADQPIKFYSQYPPTGKTSQFYGTQYYSVPDIVLPWVTQGYLNVVYQRAQLESMDNLMGELELPNAEASLAGSPSYPRVGAPGSTTWYKVIDPTPGSAAPLESGTAMLTLGQFDSFGGYEGAGYPLGSGQHDDFALKPGAAGVPGILYVEGTVFVDGDMAMTGDFEYVGKGAIICNGDFSLTDGSLLPQGGVIDANHSLGIVGPGNVKLDKSYFRGAIFCNREAGLYGTHGGVQGTTLAGNLFGESPNIYIIQDPDLSDNLAGSLPGKGGGMVFTGLWTRQ